MAKRNIIITGGAGFIGSHVVRLFVNKYPDYNIINLDKLTYAGNLANLKDVEEMSWVHYHSCRLPNSTGRVCLRGMQANASTISLPTRFTERSK